MNRDKKIHLLPGSSDGNSTAPRRVAGYARVSTELEEQQSSYSAQIAYYTEYILHHEGWELAGIYTDEGISATGTTRRSGFTSMISDALSGRIDLIITKSVSRFARNTVDSLTTIRRLKENGVEVYFEKENIWTLDAKGELLITIMSSLAQEESRSISENVTWGHRRRFAAGKVSLAYSRFLGYDRSPDGGLMINPKEAETVREIYRLYIAGLSCYAVARRLTALKIPTPCGNPVWRTSTVRSILMNEKYKGDALLQKSRTVDFLTGKRLPNHGEVPQYYVEHSHEPIIPPEIFDLVQQERRQRSARKAPGLAGKVLCGCCGAGFRPRTWHPGGRVFLQCSRKYSAHPKCPSPHIYTDELEQLAANVTGISCTDTPRLLGIIEEVTVYSRQRIEFRLSDGRCVTRSASDSG